MKQRWSAGPWCLKLVPLGSLVKKPPTLHVPVQAKARQAARLEADDEDEMPEELTANLAGKRAKRAVPAAEGLDEPNEDYEAAAAVAQAKKRRWAQCLLLKQESS